jgi:hypothetical protein
MSEKVAPRVNAKSGTHDDDTIRTGNWLPPLSAVGAALVGIFLLLGAYGHLEAVLPAVAGEGGAGTFRLLLPGTLLALGGITNIVLCRLLWTGSRAAAARSTRDQLAGAAVPRLPAHSRPARPPDHDLYRRRGVQSRRAGEHPRGPGVAPTQAGTSGRG